MTVLEKFQIILTFKIKQLRYIDDKPIFDDERRFAEAFGRGGLEEERKDRENYKQEKKDEQIKRIKDFQEMIDGWRDKTKPQNDLKLLEEKKYIDNQEDQEVNKENKLKNTTTADSKLDLLMKMNQKMQESKKLQAEKGIKLNIQEEEEVEEIVNTKLSNNDDLPSLEKIKLQSETGSWIEKEEMEVIKDHQDKIKLDEISRNIVDERLNVLKTHIDNSIFDELD